MYRVRERAVRVVFLMYTHMNPGFLFAGKTVLAAMISLPFRTLCEVLFQWLPQCPTISACSLIGLSPERPIDRSIQSDRPSLSFFLSLFSLSLALSDFSIDYSAQVFFRSFLPFNSLFLSRRRSLWNNRRSA